MKFDTEFGYAGISFSVRGVLSCEDELEIDEVFVWNGRKYVEIEVDVFKFGSAFEDLIREAIEGDAEAAAVAASEDRAEEKNFDEWVSYYG